MNTALATYPRYLQRVRRRYAAELSLLAPGLPQTAQLQQCLDALRGPYPELGSRLRVLRHLVLERVAVLDCDGAATLGEVTAAMSALAEFALDQAYQEAVRMLDAAHGPPQTAQGEAAKLWIIGMGKLGARELNVSSDIDLIYIYDDDGHTLGDAQGRAVVSNHEYFAELVKQLQTLIGEVTAHGFVFRVDLALRPHGASGPPAISLAALEDYLLLQGREWERFAWLKSRVVAPQAQRRDGSALALRALVQPFVFRRYLDYSVFESLRTLHDQIRIHAGQQAALRSAPSVDLKLGRGGIREIEFIAQLLQVVRGGQFAELRTRPTVSALNRIAAAGLMPHERAQQLAAAYEFLRRAEHRIQYLDDQQTHRLPQDAQDRLWLAQAMGFTDETAFLQHLQVQRDLVADEFDRLLRPANPPSASARSDNNSTAAEDALPPPLRQRLQQWRAQPRVQALREQPRARLELLLQRSAQWVHDSVAADGDAAAAATAQERWLDWLEPILRRESYLALLLERPGVHARLLRLLGAARWPARYLIRHPGVIDELASAQLLDERFNPTEFTAELTRRKSALSAAGDDGEEELLNLLRRAHHAEVFRTLARDLEGRLSVEQVADDLSALADTVLNICVSWCWQHLKQRPSGEPQLGIIAYGKLGGKELGYGSDLDLVFVYDDSEPGVEIYAALVRKLITWLTVKTGEGDLYEIDTALRPNGNAGLLVSSFAAFQSYQLQRGSNTAWTWEHQAITRARAVQPSFAARFEAVRHAVIAAPRDLATLKQEILAMRERVRSAHPVKSGRFDVKHSVGGMLDVEFAVQALVLAHGAAHPPLRDNAGNIALLQRAEQAGLLPAACGAAAAQAYRELRRVQHRARLNEEPTQVPGDQLQEEQKAVTALWAAVFGPVGG